MLQDKVNILLLNIVHKIHKEFNLQQHLQEFLYLIRLLKFSLNVLDNLYFNKNNFNNHTNFLYLVNLLDKLCFNNL